MDEQNTQITTEEMVISIPADEVVEETTVSEDVAVLVEEAVETSVVAE